jgi:hypothetical protein
MLNFEGFAIVPEPAVIGLAVVGVGALFLLRRHQRPASQNSEL